MQPPTHPHNPTQATQLRPPACVPRVDEPRVDDPSPGLCRVASRAWALRWGDSILHSPRRERLRVLTRNAMWQRDSNLCAGTHDFIGHLKILEISKSIQLRFEF